MSRSGSSGSDGERERIEAGSIRAGDEVTLFVDRSMSGRITAEVSWRRIPLPRGTWTTSFVI